MIRFHASQHAKIILAKYKFHSFNLETRRSRRNVIACVYALKPFWIRSGSQHGRWIIYPLTYFLVTQTFDLICHPASFLSMSCFERVLRCFKGFSNDVDISVCVFQMKNYRIFLIWKAFRRSLIYYATNLLSTVWCLCCLRMMLLFRFCLS